jgi:hypothetical protein
MKNKVVIVLSVALVLILGGVATAVFLPKSNTPQPIDSKPGAIWSNEHFLKLLREDFPATTETFSDEFLLEGTFDVCRTIGDLSYSSIAEDVSNKFGVPTSHQFVDSYIGFSVIYFCPQEDNIVWVIKK